MKILLSIIRGAAVIGLMTYNPAPAFAEDENCITATDEEGTTCKFCSKGSCWSFACTNGQADAGCNET